MFILGVEQLDSVIHINTSKEFFFEFFPHLGYYRVLSRLSCAIEWVLVDDIFSIYMSVCMLMPTS